MKKRIAIQGYYGSFHDETIQYYYQDEDVEVVPLNTFKELIDITMEGKADLGLMAIENTVAGSILSNYRLLTSSGLHVIGEIKRRIKQNLLALPGQSIDDITEVHSHPMAIQQCDQFLAQHPHIKLVYSEDTALSAYEISKNQIKKRAAIASSTAAEKFKLEILAPSIETNKRNYTRFLILEKEESRTSEEILKCNKASISFSLKHESGSLASALNFFSSIGINLSKIQSIPIIGKEWSYLFLTDLEFNDYKHFQNAIELIKGQCDDLKVYGVYIKSSHTYSENEIKKANKQIINAS
jgi:prephenate dehydratase